MATSMKRKAVDDNEIEGYVSKVSPLKLSKNEKTRYFTAEIQTGKDDQLKLVCFSPDKHALFKTAEQSDHSFRIRNGSIEPDRQGGTVIKVFGSSVLQSTKKQLNFNKMYSNYVEKEAPLQKIKKIAEIEDEYEIVTVDVKFLGLTSKEPITVNTRYGERTIFKALVSDDTGTKPLVIWTTNLFESLKMGECYRMTNLQNKIYEQEKQLNTTSQTKIIGITPLENVIDDLTLLKEDTITVEIESVLIQKTLKCSICQKTVEVGIETKTVKCGHCHFKQKKDNLIKNVIIQLNTNNKKRLILKEGPLMELLRNEGKETLFDQTDALEDYLILNGPFELKHSGNDIINTISKIE